MKCDYLIKRQHRDSKSQKGGIMAVEGILVHVYIVDHLLGTVVMKILQGSHYFLAKFVFPTGMTTYCFYVAKSKVDISKRGLSR